MSLKSGSVPGVWKTSSSSLYAGLVVSLFLARGSSVSSSRSAFRLSFECTFLGILASGDGQVAVLRCSRLVFRALLFSILSTMDWTFWGGFSRRRLGVVLGVVIRAGGFGVSRVLLKEFLRVVDLSLGLR